VPTSALPTVSTLSTVSPGPTPRTASTVIHRQTTGRDVLRVPVSDSLDGAAGAAVVQGVERAQTSGIARVELDLHGLSSYDDAGVAALLHCLTVGRRLPDGVGVHVDTDAGRRALLLALSAA
jgi:ABC-type transporter Mla MlaB component